ncbi:sn-glycerol-1-phosphate dehydrogenase [Pseudalkalibacillus hwajinpoensis]|uniref:sn-glycerol-1-phosphate dehydrogenase n=1 Tax=Guptibacillus hwajinpoensis TaxID=208199 RepID=UPI00325B764E
MVDILETIQNKMENCDCGRKHHSIPLERLDIGHNVLSNLSFYIESKDYQFVSIVCDANTFLAAGNQVTDSLNEIGINAYVCTVQTNQLGEVVADEQTLVQVLIDLPYNTDVIIAIGSGTLHDITRFICQQRNVPMISVPTAASVDGFTSAGAPLILKGVKQTIQTVCPIALFADLSILKNAPKRMTAAGYGDMLGKFTSLADWKVSHLLGNEPYCSSAAAITSSALEVCVQQVDEIASLSSKGLHTLMESLITSGVIMMILGNSRPASGAEHHLSHYWEMNYIKQGKRALLHGEKVGVATVIMTAIYRELVKDNAEMELKDKIIMWDEIKEAYSQLPTEEQLMGWLGVLEAPMTTSDLGISESLLSNALSEAHHLRERYTGLKMLNNLHISAIDLYKSVPNPNGSC